MKNLFLVGALVLFSTAAFAQSTVPALPEQSISIGRESQSVRRAPYGELTIRANSSYRIDGRKISRNELLRNIAPAVPGLAEQIRKGVKLKKAAIGVGCAGGALLFGGLSVAMAADTYSLWHTMATWDTSHVDAFSNVWLGGMIVAGTGLVLGCVSFGLGVGSISAQRKAMRLYNDAVLSARLDGHEASLSLAFTGSGMGLELKF